VDVPQTRYARSGDLRIAYQVVGEGQVDIVLVPAFLSNIEIAWEMPGVAAFLHRLAAFARLIVFDRRGTGMSDGVAGASPLEEQMDDVRAVMSAVRSSQPALLSAAEGCGLAAMFAASHPAAARALVMLSPLARLVRAPGYEWAPTREQRAAMMERVIERWGTGSTDQPWAMSAGADPAFWQLLGRYQRLSMNPAAAAAGLAAIGEMDVRELLPTIQCPALVVRRADDPDFDERHSRYVAEHIPGAAYVELQPVDSAWLGLDDELADEIQQFLTGARPPVVSDRVLATVLFTDIAGSTMQAAELGDRRWRALLERHDRVVREEVDRQRGRLVKSLGDGALAVFDGPSRAISSATAIRDRVRDLGLEIRAGLHTGECELLPDDDVGGLAVHIGARISSLAGPSEVLVSSTVHDLIVGSGHALADRGHHDLKGVPGPWRIYAVAT
jgi:class 3 adenylate cyclase